MCRLMCFELDKIWRKPSFLLSVIVLLVINIFLLWYTNLPDNDTPPLSSYQAIEKDMRDLTEKEKEVFIKKLYKDMQGAVVVNEVLNFRNSSNELNKEMEKKTMKDHPGVFEQYYQSFTSGDYLKYTDSLEQERALITEIYEEAEKVFSYDQYLNGIEEKKNTLQGISVFSNNGQESFSSRNVRKEAADYKGLSSIRTEFYPSKGIMGASSALATDVLLILLVFLFSVTLIFEEKEKKLFFITRATPAGRGKSIGAKLSALAIHCFASTAVFYGINLFYMTAVCGTGHVFRSLQSVAPCMESNLPISVLEYLALSVMTKAALLFAVGAFLVFIAIIGKQGFLPYLAGAALLAFSTLLYVLIPANSLLNWLKYLNPVGLLQTEELYGGYLNFDLFGHPIPRLLMSWIALILFGLGSSFIAIRAFLKNRSQEISKLQLPVLLHFRPHVNLYRHEGYKVFIMNRALVVLLIFALFFGYQHLSKSYTLTPTETYYQNIMTELSGELTAEKASLLKKETQRYEKAFREIERIDKMIAEGKISEQNGDNMKTPYYSETAFYPSFQKVLSQYDYVVESGGRFVYDTGYLLLLGLTDNNRLTDFLLFTACILLAFSAVFSAEYRDKSWNLLAATVRGKRSIYKSKLLICGGALLLVFGIGWLFQIIQIAKSCPLGQFGASTMALAPLRDIGLDLPLGVLLALMAILQLAALLVMLLIVLFLSDRLKNHIQALFAAVLLLAVPLAMNEMGLEFARWASLLPLFDGIATILNKNGQMLCLGYSFAAVALSAGCGFSLKRAAAK